MMNILDVKVHAMVPGTVNNIIIAQKILGYLFTSDGNSITKIRTLCLSVCLSVCLLL